MKFHFCFIGFICLLFMNLFYGCDKISTDDGDKKNP